MVMVNDNNGYNQMATVTIDCLVSGCLLSYKSS